MKITRWGWAPLALWVVACGGGAEEGPAEALDAGSSGGGDAAATDAVSPEDARRPEPDGGGSGAPRVYIHLRSTAAPVEHADGLSGQTPRAYGGGIRSFQMLRDFGDPSPVTVFDHGEGFVDVGLNDGDDTIAGSAEIAELPSGHYVLGRTVWTHVRYRLSVSAHYGGLSIPGELDDVNVLSDGVDIDGTRRDHGWYRYLFRAGAMEIPFEGTMDLTASLSSGGFMVGLEDGETVYYYLLDLDVGPEAVDVHMIMEVNVHECFRWQDQDEPGYAPGIFDLTAASFEPVRQAGANSYRVLRE